jgi:hypothetical protein
MEIVDIYSKELGFGGETMVCWMTHKVQAFFDEKFNLYSTKICPKFNWKNGRHLG